LVSIKKIIKKKSPQTLLWTFRHSSADRAGATKKPKQSPWASESSTRLLKKQKKRKKKDQKKSPQTLLNSFPCPSLSARKQRKKQSRAHGLLVCASTRSSVILVIL
jgi:site-specific DNA-cytosine methylase